MKNTAFLSIVFLSLVSLSPVSCKKKIVDAPQKSPDSEAQLLKSDQWQGNADQIDPQLGKIKTLD